MKQAYVLHEPEMWYINLTDTGSLSMGGTHKASSSKFRSLPKDSASGTLSLSLRDGALTAASDSWSHEACLN